MDAGTEALNFKYQLLYNLASGKRENGQIKYQTMASLSFQNPGIYNLKIATVAHDYK